jgi:uncharacterized protein (TIGR03083 family)
MAEGTDVDDDFDVLEELWQRWCDLGRRLDGEAWVRPTRCEGWTVADVFAHVSQGISGLEGLATRRVVEGLPEHRSAAALLRALKPAPEVATELAEVTARRATDDASAVSRQEMINRFCRDGSQAVSEARLKRGATVDYFRHGTTTIEASVHLRIVEALIHLLDVDDALDEEINLPDAALRRTTDFLVEMTPPRVFIEFASGRSDVHPFPVHS